MAPRLLSPHRALALSAVVVAVACHIAVAQALQPPLTVAIGSFRLIEGLPSHRWLGAYLADSLASRLAGARGLRIVERERADEVLKELELSLSDLASAGSQIRLGGIAVASHLVVGSYVVQGTQLEATARLVSVQTGTAVGGATATGDTSRIALLVDGLAQQLSRAAGLPVGPEDRPGDSSLSIAGHRSLGRARELWASLPFHELDPRRRRNATTYQQAVDQLDQILTEDPSVAEVHFYAGEFLLQLGLFQEAETYFAQLKNGPSEIALACLGRGDMERHRGDPARAADWYARSLQSGLRIAGAYYGLSRCLTAQGDEIGAFVHLLRAIEIEPQREVLRSLVDSLAAAGTLQRAIASSPGNAAELEALGAWRVAQTESSTALGFPEVSNALRVYPDLYVLPFVEARAHYVAARLEAAEAALQRTLRLFPTYDAAHLMLGHVLKARGDDAGAVSHFRTYIRLSTGGKDFAEINGLISECLRRLGL